MKISKASSSMSDLRINGQHEELLPVIIDQEIGESRSDGGVDQLDHRQALRPSSYGRCAAAMRRLRGAISGFAFLGPI